MESGRLIRQLREERFLKPSDIERISRSIADAKGNSDFYVPHSTLADIETGSIPSIHKLFSLATCLKLPLHELLLPFGIDPNELTTYTSQLESNAPALQPISGLQPSFRFQLHFDTKFTTQETTLLRFQPQDAAALPPPLQGWLDPKRYRYAVIGSKDESMADVLPPRSICEIDPAQNTVEVFPWRTLRARPLYLVWHPEGYSCCWCQLDGKDLTLLPHPLSQYPVRRFKISREADVIGRLINAWFPFARPYIPGAAYGTGA